ncbi:MAG: SprT family protein [Sporolactobacillus sp.]
MYDWNKSRGKGECKEMTNEELQKLVQQVSLQSFHRPFHHQAIFNTHLRTTGGRYLLASHGLEFNPKQLAYFGQEAFIKIIKHELCHYHLHLSGQGYRHRDPSFRELLRRVGGTRFCGQIPGSGNKSQAYYSYCCTSCGLIFHRRRRIDTTRFVCGSCGGQLRPESADHQILE